MPYNGFSPASVSVARWLPELRSEEKVARHPPSPYTPSRAQLQSCRPFPGLSSPLTYRRPALVYVVIPRSPWRPRDLLLAFNVAPGFSPASLIRVGLGCPDNPGRCRI